MTLMTQPKDGGVNAAAKFTAAVNNDLVCVFLSHLSAVCARSATAFLTLGAFCATKSKGVE